MLTDWSVHFINPTRRRDYFLTPQKSEPSYDNLGNIPPGVRKPPAERREKILEAATALFVASGYRMTGVQDIADRVKGGFS